MTIVQPSIGYPGNLSADGERWSRAQWGLGRRYWVYDYAALLLTPVQAGTRQVSIGGGAFGGHGVIDQNDAPVVLSLPAVATGTQWFMVVARRVWGTTNATSFQVLPGPVQASPPVDLSGWNAVRHVERGADDDQPLWLVPLQAGFTVPGAPIDLRLLGTDKGPMVAHNTLVLQYATWEGAEIQIGSRVYRRVSDPTTGTGKWFDWSVGATENDTLQIFNGAQFLTKQSYFSFDRSGLVNRLRRHRNLYEVTFQLMFTSWGQPGAAVITSTTTTSDNFADTPLVQLQSAYRPPEDMAVPVVYRGNNMSNTSDVKAIVGGMCRVQASNGIIEFVSGAANYAMTMESASATGGSSWTVKGKFQFLKE